VLTGEVLLEALALGLVVTSTLVLDLGGTVEVLLLLAGTLGLSGTSALGVQLTVNKLGLGDLLLNLGLDVSLLAGVLAAHLGLDLGGTVLGLVALALNFLLLASTGMGITVVDDSGLKGGLVGGGSGGDGLLLLGGYCRGVRKRTECELR